MKCCYDGTKSSERIFSLQQRQLFGCAIAVCQAIHRHLRDAVVMHESSCDHEDVEDLVAVELRQKNYL